MFPLYLVDLSTNRTIAVLGGGIRGPYIFIRNIRFSNHTSRFNRFRPTSPPTKKISTFSFPQRVLTSGVQYRSMDNFFVDALVRASLCKNHSSTYPSVNHGGFSFLQRRSLIISRGSFDAYKRGPDDGSISWKETRDELRSIADPYWRRHLEFPPPVPLYLREARAAQDRVLPARYLDDPREQEFLDEFLEYLVDPKTPHTKLYELYSRLSPPRPILLNQQELDMLVARFMSVPERNLEATTRYLAILDQMKACDLPISRNEWNAAISFVSRSFNDVTTTETQAAIALWDESENYQGGTRANTTTFNVLLDVASRSPTPLLTEMILKEMQDRDLKPDRFTYTTLITYHGICGDGDKVREAYRELVDSGEIVDTVVLNAVMTAMIRAKEHGSAEYIYARMRLTLFDPGTTEKPPSQQDFKGLRRWARNLKRVAMNRRVVEDYMNTFNVSLAPDIITFNMVILLQCQVGNYDRAMELLEEMKECKVDYDETISIALLKGFFWHGGATHSDWSNARLEELLRRIFDQEKGHKLGSNLSKWILKTVAKVYNSRTRVFMIWEAILAKQRSDGEEPDEHNADIAREIVGGPAWNTWLEEQKQKNR
ncbi:hypothetical protein L873DRAFT_1663492 [Choiromyces venosus 120613-1]|uniref:Pentacotripeptide-repeat region of PRORP domain-containing protein n=1 Tax=Choiromyces venosus 120613-1 TaxID=1336337 RepID=A0A3N4K3E5_9PEZI|nr:hypothetical protein L873DRAFT_1663492 [Choiromyces venosus 120613-1]